MFVVLVTITSFVQVDIVTVVDDSITSFDLLGVSDLCDVCTEQF